MKIPLFPLDLVLFPGVPLPLHIFEPRYREMTAQCLAEDAPFGIVRTRPEGLAVIGCTAQIVRVLHRYPDGRSDILTQGIERFEIEQLIGQGNDGDTYLQAAVDILPDIGEPATRSAREECVGLHFEALHLLGASEASMQLDLDQPIAYLIAASMPTDLDFRQTLLAERSDTARTETLLRYYREILPKLRRSRQVNQRASTNGHIM
jgi:Lon protease-like protein